MNIEEHKKISANCLYETSNILYELSVDYMLALGTILGAYRDKDFCPGDVDDIDLFLAEDQYEKADEIQQAMFKDGWRTHMIWKDEDELSVEYSFKKEVGDYRVKIDMWFLSTNPNNDKEYFFRMYKRPDEYRQYTFDKKFFDNKKDVEFYGNKYPIPKDTEEYLEYNYGKDWRTPIHRDNWDYYNSNKSKTI